jgi:ribosomal protein L37AE/L43A
VRQSTLPIPGQTRVSCPLCFSVAEKHPGGLWQCVKCGQVFSELIFGRKGIDAYAFKDENLNEKTPQLPGSSSGSVVSTSIPGPTT